MHLSPHLRPGRSGSCWSLSVVGAVASAIEMALLYHPAANTTRLYFGTDTHAQSILVGSVLACAMTMIQMRRGDEGMAPTARSAGPGCVLVRRSAWPASPAPSPSPTPWPAPPPSTTGAGSCSRPCRPRPSSSARCACPAAPSPGSCRSGPWCGWAPSPMAPTCGTTRSSSTSTPPAPACRTLPAGRPLRLHLRPGRRQLLPGRAAGHVRHVLALAQGHRPGRRPDGGHRGRGRRRHRGAGHRGGAGEAVPGAVAERTRRWCVLGDSTALPWAALAATAPAGTTVVNGGLFGCGLAIGTTVSNPPPTPAGHVPSLQLGDPGHEQWPAVDTRAVAGTAPGDVVLFVAGNWEVQDLLRTADGPTSSSRRSSATSCPRCARR